MMRPTVVSVAPLILIAVALEACAPSSTPTPVPEAPAGTAVSPSRTAGTHVVSSAPDPRPPSPPPTPGPGAPAGPAVSPSRTAGTNVVSSALDRGPGSLRDALLDAREGDIITFDPAVFPPAAPAVISLAGALPEITQDHLTIDASDA